MTKEPSNLFAQERPDVLMAMVEDRLAAERVGETNPKPKSKSKARQRRASKKAAASDEAKPRRMIPVNRRLGFRPGEFAKLIGVSDVTVWRGIRDGKIDTVDQAGIKIIPRAFAIRAGYITADDVI